MYVYIQKYEVFFFLIINLFVLGGRVWEKKINEIE